MKQILSRLLLWSQGGLIIFVLAALSACLANNKVAGPNENDSESPAQQKGVSSVESHPYVYNRPHQVPSDYVYRTERIIGPPGSKPFSPKGGTSAGSGSQKPPVSSPGKEYASQLVSRVHDLVEQLLQGEDEVLEEDQRVLVSSFVNLNDLYKTSALGRMLCEQMISELQRAGIEVLDVRKTPDLLIHRRWGEFGLSRDTEELPYIHEAHAMVVGTYSAADGQIFVNARILRNSDGFVMASASMVLEENTLLSSLLEDEGGPVNRRFDTVQVEAQ